MAHAQVPKQSPVDIQGVLSTRSGTGLDLIHSEIIVDAKDIILKPRVPKWPLGLHQAAPRAKKSVTPI